jgi:hypothetical protein
MSDLTTADTERTEEITTLCELSGFRGLWGCLRPELKRQAENGSRINPTLASSVEFREAPRSEAEWAFDSIAS